MGVILFSVLLHPISNALAKDVVVSRETKQLLGKLSEALAHDPLACLP